SHTPSASALENPSLTSPTACPPTPAGQLSEGAPAAAGPRRLLGRRGVDPGGAVRRPGRDSHPKRFAELGPDRPEGDPRVARRGDDAEGRLAVCERAFAVGSVRDLRRGRL